MAGEATQAELDNASEIIMEGSDSDSSNDSGAEENNSLFGEEVPDIKDPRDVEDGTVTVVKDETDVDDADKTLKVDDVDPGKEKKPEVNSDEPDEITKLTEHKSNLEKALNESRAKTKSLQFIVDQQKNQPPPNVDATTKIDPDFKVLSKDEFEELKGESAVDALQYMHDLTSHKEALTEQARIDAQVEQVKVSVDNLVAASIEQISLAVPGIYEDEAVGQKLTDFAVEQGFDNDSLSILSNPATMVLLPGSNAPVPLGKTAADFVKFCNSSMVGSDDTDLRATLTEEITATVTKDLLAKFKNNPTGVGLDDVAAAGSGSPHVFIAKTENELRNMSPQEREDYYQGK